MEEEQNQSQEQATTPIPKLNGPKKPKLNPDMYILVTIILMAATGFGVYYFVNDQKNQQLGDMRRSLNNVQKAQTKDKVEHKKPQATQNTVTPQTTENELDTLRAFCNKSAGPNGVVGNIVYAESPDGKFASCGVGDAAGFGGTIIAYQKENQWTKIAITQNALPPSTCKQYKIPGAIGGCDRV